MSAVKQAYAEGLAFEAAITWEVETIGTVDATTTLTDAGTSATADAVRDVVRKLEAANAKPHPSTPGGQFYAGVFSPEAAYDMMGEGAPAWFQVKSSDYSTSLVTPFQDTPATAAVYNCLIKTSTSIQASSAQDLNLIIGNEAFGVADIDTDALAPKLIFTDPEQNYAKPLRNRGEIGWWGLFDSVLFDSNRVGIVMSDQT